MVVVMPTHGCALCASVCVLACSRK